MQRPETVRNRARGLAIGHISRFEGSPVYDEVKSLPHCKGPGLELKPDGSFHWLGDAGEAIELLKDQLGKAAGLNHEERATLWSFLDYKRHDVWYVKGQKRTSDSRQDEEDTGEMVAFEFNNLTVALKEGYTLLHFMAIHYGTNWFSYHVWDRYREWRDNQAVGVTSTSLPDFIVEKAPEGLGDRAIWYAKMRLMANIPELVSPELAINRCTGTFHKKYAEATVAYKEDEKAAKDIMSKAAKLS